METQSLRTALPGPAVERHDDERLALNRAVQATLAGLAEMDRLLGRAERLISHRRSCCAPNGMRVGHLDPVC
jgi:hypothetical protein